MSGVRSDVGRQINDAKATYKDYDIEIFECRNSKERKA